MPTELPSWENAPPDESSHSGVGPFGPWDDSYEFTSGVGEDDLRDAFDLDDLDHEPEPEYGDFWVEPAEDGGEKA